MSAGMRRRRQAYFGPPAPPAAREREWLSPREYVDLRFYELEKRMEQSGTLYLAAQSERQNAMEKRLEAMNEFRGQLNTQASTFATRENVDQRITAQETLSRTLADANEKLTETHYTENRKRIEALERFQANTQGRITAYSSLAVLVSAAVAIVLHFWH